MDIFVVSPGTEFFWRHLDSTRKRNLGHYQAGRKDTGNAH